MMTKKKTTTNNEKITKKDFGLCYSELEEIIKWFDNGEINLDEGLKKFERGLFLAKECREYLDEVEIKVKELKTKFG